MATISQLMEGATPGSVKVRHADWHAEGGYFTPYYNTYAALSITTPRKLRCLANTAG